MVSASTKPNFGVKFPIGKSLRCTRHILESPKLKSKTIESDLRAAPFRQKEAKPSSASTPGIRTHWRRSTRTSRPFTAKRQARRREARTIYREAAGSARSPLCTAKRQVLSAEARWSCHVPRSGRFRTTTVPSTPRPFATALRGRRRAVPPDIPQASELSVYEPRPILPDWTARNSTLIGGSANLVGAPWLHLDVVISISARSPYLSDISRLLGRNSFTFHFQLEWRGYLVSYAAAQLASPTRRARSFAAALRAGADEKALEA
ncbi:hypothetical protein C8R43DRAFT_952232 [Mycena crocata]|nr:hypothetical protein C8R43DRAFT_952232 [Mycena crocata]